MSFELRLSQLKKAWLEIQADREEMHKARKLAQKYNKRVRELAQLIPKKLNEYNKIMV